MRPAGGSVGEVVEGRYLLRRELGRGAAGVVLEAQDGRTGRSVVLKIGSPDLPESRLPEWRARFSREARALAAIKHPGVVGVLDSGALEDGTPYIVMENLEGRTLEGLLATRGKLPPAATIAMALQICDALAAVHQAGIVHRDLKPSNIIMTRAPDGAERATLIDFGMAQIRGDDKITGIGAVVGTPEYMSPEQLLAQDDVDRRADIYALGITMFECLTGSVPYPGPYGHVVLKACGDGPLPPLPAQVHPTLAEIVHRAMAKARQQRYVAATEAARALRQAAKELGTTTEGTLSPTPAAQRRRWQRAPYNAPVEIALGGRVIDGRIEDISLGGILVICWENVASEGSGRARFALPIEGRVTRCDVLLRWNRSADPTRNIGPRALGFEFVDPPLELRDSVSRYVQLMGSREDQPQESAPSPK